MSFPTVKIVDDFNRANESPATGWTAISTLANFRVVSNQLQGISLQNAAYFNATTYSANCETACDLGTLPGAGGLVEIGLRGKDIGSVTTVDGYSLRMTIVDAGTDTFTLYRTDNGVSTSLGTFNQEVASGDSMGIRAAASLIEAWYKPAAGNWTRLGTATDSTYTAGGYATLVVVSTTATIDNFRAGDYSPYLERVSIKRAQRNILVLR